MVDIWSAGNYGSEEDRTRRLARPLCFLRTDPTDNGYVRPIEGLRPVVDLNTMQVIRVEEHGHWPLPPGECNYAADRVTDSPPRHQAARDHAARGAELRGRRPPGPLAELELRHRLQRPRRADAAPPALPRRRQGSLDSVSRVAHRDGRALRRSRPPRSARKNAFDVGEYGMGMCANSLELGCDCLGLIHYFDAHMVTSRGEPLTIKNAICMHEEDFGILWKHTDRRLNTPEVRRSRRLVISSISTVENYEYGFFWYLYQDGNIQFEVKLTGILSLGALQPGEKPKYGTLIAPQLYAPNHQHFFNVRLDFDLDGAANTVQQVDVVPDELGADNPFENAFQARATTLKTEKQARAHLKLRDGADVEDHQPGRHERRRRAGRLQVPAGRQLRSRWPRPTPGGGSGPAS